MALIEDQIHVAETPLAARPERGRWVRRAVLGAAAAVVLLAVVGVIIRRDEGAVVEPFTEPFTPVPAANGWLAQVFGTGIWLGRAGDADRMIDSRGPEACPAFSPDGERLMYGRATPYGDGDTYAALEILTVAHGTVSPFTTIPLDGIEGIPCAIWAPDGRWAALGGGGSVWVVDTKTAEIRQLPGYAPKDLEWRPGTDELAITGLARASNAPIDIYTVSTGEVRTLDDAEAVDLTWSPDGTTIAYTQAVPGAATTMSGITLIDADGTNPRPLTTDDYVADHGIGVVWSPRGDQIAYQQERTACTGDACHERSEIVLVTATDTDPATPIGTERAIPPVVNNLLITRFQSMYNTLPPIHVSPWYADSVTWSPDGTELLYYCAMTNAGLLSVPADGTGPVIVLDGDALMGINDEDATTPWLPLQQWQPVP